MNIASLNTFLKDFTTKPHELFLFRIWLVLLIFYIPLFGFLLINCKPNAIEFMSHRYVLSLILVFLFFTSFVSKLVQKYLVLFVYSCNFVALGWVIWIVYKNNFSPNYSIGLFLTIACMGVMMRNLKGMISIYVFSLSLISYAFYLLPQAEIDKHIYWMSLLALIIVSSIIMYQRNIMSRALIMANKDLSSRNIELEQFAYIVSHDLKSPLRTIGSFVGLLKRKINTTDQQNIIEYIDFINNGVKQMSNVIDDLLLYSTVGHQEISIVPINIKSLVSEVATILLSNPDNNCVHLQGIEQLPHKIIANPIQIKQIYQNLIQNAIKYNRSTQKKIILSYQETHTHWQFLVRDNGIGIDKEYHEKVFQLFKRLHTTLEYEGTGLGLAICKRIVERHEGTITLQSTLNQGTTVQFSISKKLRE